MTEAQKKDRTKYIVFADYNGMMFPVERVGTIKRAREVAKREATQRRGGLALTMRTFKQVEHLRLNRDGEAV